MLCYFMSSTYQFTEWKGKVDMPLIETLAIGVGSSIAKAILKLWLKDNSIAIDAGTTIIDIVKTRTSDKLSQRKAQREFDEIGERVGQSLLPIFEMEGANFEENDKIAIAEAVADTLNTATSSILAQNDLNPRGLAAYLLKTHPAEFYLFNETEGLLYRRMIQESCIYIVDIASRLPTFTEQTFAEVLQRETQILEKVDKVLQEVQHLREQQNPVEAAAQFELDYRRTVKRELDKLEWFGENVRGASREQSLSVAYVRLSVEHTIQKISKQAQFEDLLDRSGSISLSNQGGDRASAQASTETVQKSIVVVDEALVYTKRLLIRGPAGSGKTTLPVSYTHLTLPTILRV